MKKGNEMPIFNKKLTKPNKNLVNPNFDAWNLLNVVKTSMPGIGYINLWTGWGWYQIANAKAALSDPYVLNLNNLNRPI